uniref:VWFA domain-containing protein n=1 Tax=Strongyloides papillosus TaxID=174720 RepID=A0A0N5BIG8_STREA
MIKYRKVYIKVTNIKTCIRYDFHTNKFHKELEIFDYNVQCGTDFPLFKEELEVINTDITPVINEAYKPEAGEKKLKEIFNMQTNISCTTNILILLKVEPNDNDQSNSKKGAFNILIGDRDGAIMNCIAYNVNPTNNVYKNIEVGHYYTLKLVGAKLASNSKNNYKNFTSFDAGLVLTFDTVHFVPTTKKFAFPSSYIVMETIDLISERAENDQANAVGIITKIEEIGTQPADSNKNLTTRRVIFISDGKSTMPVYIYGELAYYDFTIRNLIGIKFANVRKHTSCGIFIMCNRMSKLTSVNPSEHSDLHAIAKTLDLNELKHANLTSILSTNAVIEQGKYLLHIVDTPEEKIQPYRFYMIGKIASFSDFMIPSNPELQEEGSFYSKITIKDPLNNITDVALFINKMGKIAPDLSSIIEKLMSEKVNMNNFLEKLLNIPMVFKIKLTNNPTLSNDGKKMICFGNKVIEHVDFCSNGEYKEWMKRMLKDIVEFGKLG